MQTHLPPADELRRLLQIAETRGLSTRARERLTWLIWYREQGESVSETCRHFGITRITFYRLLNRFDPADLRTLEDQSRRPHTVRPSSLPAETLSLIRAYRERHPQMGKEKITQLLGSEHGIQVSSSAVGRAIARERMYFGDTPLHWRKRQERAAEPARVGEEIGEIEELKERPSSISRPAIIQNPTHHCGWCTFRERFWPRMKRAFVVACVLTNLAILGTSLFTALWETDLDVKADLRGDGTPTHSFVILPE